MTTIAPGTYSDGGYKRTDPEVVGVEYFDLSASERAAKSNGKRGCSLAGDDMRDIAKKCVNAAADLNAKSWSIWPILYHNTVMVEFHSWPEWGLCNFKQPVARKNYWFDERPVPEWMAPMDPMAEPDKDGHFDVDA